MLRRHKGIVMRRWLLVAAAIALPVLAWGETVELLKEWRFDSAAPPADWTLEGPAAWQDGALYTVSVPENHATAKCDTGVPLPSGPDAYLLRLEWTLVPVCIGGWGQDSRVDNGPCVVEFTGERPTLNAKHRARDTVKAGEQAVVSYDFNQHAVFSWRINGTEQLDRPVPAWHTGATNAVLSCSDYKESNSETRWLGVKLFKVVPDDPFPLALSGWDMYPIVTPDAPAPFLVRVASPMQKIFREAADLPTDLGTRATIAAAGRERESYQLVLIPLGRPLTNVQVTPSALVQVDGAGRLEADRIQWYRVDYVQTQPSNSAIQRVGWWWPDPLQLPGPFDVAAGYVQPLWFTVDVPADAAAGAYRGLVTVTADGAAPQHVPVELTVRPYALPLRGALKTAFCISPGLFEIWYRPNEVKQRLGMGDDTKHGPLYSSYECEDVLPREKWLAVYDFLLAHRLSPTVIYSGFKNGRTRTVPAREDMQYCYDRGMNATCLANVDVLPGDPAAADKRMAEIEAWLRDWEGFAKEKNWPDFTWYVHGFDESEMRPNPGETVDPSIRRVYGMIGEKFPWLNRETANPVNEKHYGFFDIWTPVTPQISAEKLPEYRARQEAGDEVWAYVCCGPGKPYANLFVDFPGVDPRILGWQFYQHGMTGFLYYLINLWDTQENWNMDAPKWPEKPWNTYSFRTNSDGILFYPGPDMTPLPSVRMENLRDGIEDYEALKILAGLVAQVEQDGRHPDLVARAREVLAVRPDVSASWTEYTQDPHRIAAARAEVDALIGEAMAAAGTAP